MRTRAKGTLARLYKNMWKYLAKFFKWLMADYCDVCGRRIGTTDFYSERKLSWLPNRCWKFHDTCWVKWNETRFEKPY